MKRYSNTLYFSCVRSSKILRQMEHRLSFLQNYFLMPYWGLKSMLKGKLVIKNQNNHFQLNILFRNIKFIWLLWLFRFKINRIWKTQSMPIPPRFYQARRKSSDLMNSLPSILSSYFQCNQSHANLIPDYCVSYFWILFCQKFYLKVGLSLGKNNAKVSRKLMLEI